MKNNNTIEAIYNRRSIRKYDKERPVERKKLEQLIRAAMYAPTARNLQPWHFIIITEREVLDRIPSIHPYAKMVHQASAAILVCGDRSKEPNDIYLAKNCSAATQNILLEAYALGIGSVWLGVFGREERMKNLSSLFNLPEDIVPISLIALGYPDEIKSMPDRFQKNLIDENRFGEKWSL